MPKIETAITYTHQEIIDLANADARAKFPGRYGTVIISGKIGNTAGPIDDLSIRVTVVCDIKEPANG